MKKLLTLTVCALLFANAGMAATTNMVSSHRIDRYQPGTHQFYAWCAGRDRLLLQRGVSAQDAGATLAASPQAVGCRLSWQGRIGN